MTDVRAIAAPPRRGTREVVAPAPVPRVLAARPRSGRWLRLGHLSPYARGVVAITLLGLVARFVALGHQPLWRDEAFTELAARRSWLGMLDVVRHDSAPPLSYVLAHLATSVSTASWALRTPAALAGAAAIPVAAALGRRVGGDRAALYAAGLVAISPLSVMLERDARMYSLGGTLVLVTALALWRAVERPTRGRLVVVAAGVAAALLTQYLTVLAIGAIALAARAVLRPGRATALRCAAAIGIGVIPLLLWLPAATAQFAHAGDPFWVQSVSGPALLGVLTGFFCGPGVDPSTPHRALLQWLQGVAIAAGGIGGLVLILHTLFRAPRGQQRATAYVALCGWLGLGALLGVSLVKSVLDARYAFVLELPLLVLVGVGVGRIRPRALALAPLLVMAVTTTALIVYPTRSDVAALVPTLGDRPRAGEVVLAHREVYLGSLVAESPAFQAVTHVPDDRLDWFWGTAIFPPGAYLPVLPAGTTRVDELVDTTTPGPSAVPAGWHVVGHVCATDACLTVWER